MNEAEIQQDRLPNIDGFGMPAPIVWVIRCIVCGRAAEVIRVNSYCKEHAREKLLAEIKVGASTFPLPEWLQPSPSD